MIILPTYSVQKEGEEILIKFLIYANNTVRKAGIVDNAKFHTCGDDSLTTKYIHKDDESSNTKLFP